MGDDGTSHIYPSSFIHLGKKKLTLEFCINETLAPCGCLRLQTHHTNLILIFGSNGEKRATQMQFILKIPSGNCFQKFLPTWKQEFRSGVEQNIKPTRSSWGPYFYCFFNNLFSSLWIYINWSWQLIEEFTIKRPSWILRLVKWYQNSRVIKSFHLHYRSSSKPFLAKPYHQSIWSTMCFNPLEPRVRFKQNYRTQHGKRPIYTIVTNLNNFTTEFYSFTTEN